MGTGEDVGLGWNWRGIMAWMTIGCMGYHVGNANVPILSSSISTIYPIFRQ